MHFVEILGSKSKQQNNKKTSYISTFKHLSMPSKEREKTFLSIDSTDGCRKIRAKNLMVLSLWFWL